MTPTDHAAAELGLWESALAELREAQKRLRHTERGASEANARPRIELIEKIEALQMRADLLLADAIHVKSMFRDQRDGYAELAGPEADEPTGAAVWIWPREHRRAKT